MAPLRWASWLSSVVLTDGGSTTLSFARLMPFAALAASSSGAACSMASKNTPLLASRSSSTRSSSACCAAIACSRAWRFSSSRARSRACCRSLRIRSFWIRCFSFSTLAICSASSRAARTRRSPASIAFSPPCCVLCMDRAAEQGFCAVIKRACPIGARVIRAGQLTGYQAGRVIRERRNNNGRSLGGRGGGVHYPRITLRDAVP
jgi:hypothetical protein